MSRAVDVHGQRYGRLVVVERGEARHGQRLWVCRCDCGAMHNAPSSALRAGRVKSCGCLSAEMTTARNTKHGHAKRGRQHPLYFIWRAIVKRCTDPRDKDYLLYGGRGIRVCEKWRQDFAAFLADVGERPDPKLTVDRRDNEGDYEPGNIRWATQSEQALNRRSRWRNR